MNTPNKRERLIDSAATLFHKKGVVATSLADIAKEADIPIGNVYYYFKTKEELALAAILKHKENHAAFYQHLNENIDDPRERLIAAISMYEKVKADFAAHGCPIGKIILDSGGENESIAKAAASVFATFIEWAEMQFNQLGQNENARAYATTLMAGIQGATIMAKALSDETILVNEINRLITFTQNLPNKRIQLGKLGMKTAVA